MKTIMPMLVVALLAGAAMTSCTADDDYNYVRKELNDRNSTSAPQDTVKINSVEYHDSPELMK